MSPLVETVLFVFGLAALGYVSGICGYLKPAIGDAVAEFAVKVSLPVLLFRTMAHADFHGAAPWTLWTVYFFAAAVTWIAGHLTVTRIFGRNGAAGVVGGVSAAFSNTVLLGIPFILGVYGRDGVEILSLIISVHLAVMMVASIVLFETFGEGRKAPVRRRELAIGFLFKLFGNPIIVGILAGLVWHLMGLGLPSLAGRFVDAIADTAGPLALFAMGLSLRKFGISGNLLPSVTLSALKLVLMPAIVLAAAWLFGLPPLAAKIAVTTASMPTGVNSYLIAVQFRTSQGLASSQLTLSTVMAVVTTAFWLTVAHAVFG
ncbi:MAG: AEC family transporter [Rhizobiaceae bacterium]|jgi:predicted permease